VRRERRVLLLLRRRSRFLLIPDPLDGGATLAPPTAVVRPGKPSARVARDLGRAHGALGDPRGPSRTFRHKTYSHDYTIEVWEAEAPAAPGGALRDGTRWSARGELQRLPLRATTLKAIKGL
jgi:hypothetical protein